MRLFSLFLALLLAGQAQANSNWKAVHQAVNYSVGRILPQGSTWSINTPQFLAETTNQNIEDIEVTFPSGLSEKKLIAQVWIKTDKQENLVAVPVKIKILGANQSYTAYNNH